MNKDTRYIIVTADTVGELEKRVNAFINSNGLSWSPAGAPMVTASPGILSAEWWYQAMWKDPK